MTGVQPCAVPISRLGELGVRPIVLAFDNDPAGYDATRRAIDIAVTVPSGPELFVLDPDLLDDMKDPGALIASRGLHEWQDVTATPVCAIEWRGLDLLAPLAAGDVLAERAALGRATDWLATLTDRHAIARGRASHLVADALGSSDTDVTSQVAALRDELAADTSASVA